MKKIVVTVALLAPLLLGAAIVEDGDGFKVYDEQKSEEITFFFEDKFFEDINVGTGQDFVPSGSPFQIKVNLIAGALVIRIGVVAGLTPTVVTIIKINILRVGGGIGTHGDAGAEANARTISFTISSTLFTTLLMAYASVCNNPIFTDGPQCPCTPSTLSRAGGGGDFIKSNGFICVVTNVIPGS